MSGSLGAPSTGDDLLDRWIRALRERLERGEFTGRAPIDLGEGTEVLPAYLTIRLMLDELNHLGERVIHADASPDHVMRRRRRIDDFRRLRALIG